jgi:thiamine biosynthesis protein ThiI
MNYKKIILHYGEIGLKGKNRISFEKVLVNNIKRELKNYFKKIDEEKISKVNFQDKNDLNNFFKVNREKGRILIDFKFYLSEELNFDLIEILKHIPGIVNFSFCIEVKKDIDEIKKEIKNIIIKEKNNLGVISFKTKRADKKFPLISPQINNHLLKIAKDLGVETDYKNYDSEIKIEITHTDYAYIYSKKYYGLGGLPVGSVGRVLVLLSGGIDSPVAAIKMMKRGVRCDFLHIHNFASNNIVKNSKIIDTIKILNKFQTFSNLYLDSYNNFNFEVLSSKVDSRYELLLFKYYIIKLAEKIVLENDYDGIVLGDSLAQVASQTIENLKVVSNEINTLIFRPLITYDKEEIIELSKNFNLFDLSIKEYKDCCSLVSKNPITKGKIEKFKKELSKLNFEKLIKTSFNNLEKVFID